MKNQLIILSIVSILVASCKNEIYLSKIVGQRISITDSLDTNKAIETYVKPYRDRVNKDLDSVLAYAVDTFSKNDGELNTAIGNFMADAVFDESNPVFLKRTGKTIDMVLLNNGGIRSIISKGNITSRTAYQVMPFENSVVVAALKGTQVNAMFTYLANAKRAHPVSRQIQLTLNKEGTIRSATINGNEIDKTQVYYVATNDYLANGGDGMAFFQPNDSLYVLDYKIRNILIDKFKKIDTLQPTIDSRFIQLKD
jgi:5'-nucleotidase